MCGVVGLLIKDRSLEPSLGTLLEPMIVALSDRGPDSSGIAVYSEQGERAADSQFRRISFGSDESVDWGGLCAEVVDRFDARARPLSSGAVVEIPQPSVGEVTAFVAGQWPAARIVATGSFVVVVKDTGRPEVTTRRIDLAGWGGYLGLAHTRMATESAVTLLHSHPFVPAPDLCIVHNGSFSNYATVRRSLHARGIEFDSDNDSEVAARLLAERLDGGDDLEEATRWIMKELDGFFTLVIATSSGMSVVRDAFACKPAVVAEAASYVAVASEYRALAHLPGIADADVFEPRPEEVYSWTR
jgi:methylamine---glutamate N-methyltransferase subunit A